MAYLENQTIEIEMHDFTLTVICDIDWNGRPSNSEVYDMELINGLPAYWFSKTYRGDIERAILKHLHEDSLAKLESQDEMRSDEARGH